MKSHEVKNQWLILLREKISELLNIRPKAPSDRAKLELSHSIFSADSIMPSSKLAKIQTAFGNKFSLMTPRGNRT
jgi:hypothetical protein